MLNNDSLEMRMLETVRMEENEKKLIFEGSTHLSSTR